MQGWTAPIRTVVDSLLCYCVQGSSFLLEHRNSVNVTTKASYFACACVYVRVCACMYVCVFVHLGAFTEDGQRRRNEFILLFAVFDETKSWYGEIGERRSRERYKKSSGRKQYHTINGYVNSTLPGNLITLFHSGTFGTLRQDSEKRVKCVTLLKQ